MWFWIGIVFLVLVILYIVGIIIKNKIKKAQDKDGKPPDDRYPMW